MFNLNAYRVAQREGTRAMAATAPRMLEMLEEERQGGRARTEQTTRTLKSFLLQEGEAASRQAKCRWCRKEGIAVYQLQHYGIAVAKQADEERVARAMSDAASAACGMRVIVAAEE